LALSTLSLPRAAQGQIILRLPDDGTWVRYEGSYRVQSSEAEAPNVEKTYVQHITISSVGREMVDGAPARWLEIKVETSSEGADSVEQGKYGLQLYKVLVREQDVTQSSREYLPIVRGYRRYGQSEAKPLASGLLRFCPSVSLVDHYLDLREVGSEDVASGLGTLRCAHLKGTRTRESENSRSKNEGEIWVSQEAPFGAVRWKSTLFLEVTKFIDGQTRTLPDSTKTTEMAAAEVGQGAVSEMPEVN
jgi:hypothetical protein